MKYIFFAGLIAISACSTNRPAANTKNAFAAQPKNISLNGKLFTSLYQQRAAEYRALCLQACNIARLRIDGFVPQTTKPKAVITDIDETILNNSPYAVQQAYAGKEYDSESWYLWTAKANADTMPGAAALLAYAASKNIEIFYITNREERERGATLKNLQHFNLPDTDDAHFIPRTGASSKETRRQQVMQRYEVVLLMGDNLSDFSELFDRKTETERRANTDLSAGEFGNRFIIFPNPGYGDWEGSLYQYNYKLSQPQKDSVMRSLLQSF